MGDQPLAHRFESSGRELAAHLAVVDRAEGLRPGVVLCHGYPSGIGGGPKSAHTYPQLADRLAAETGAVVLAFMPRPSVKSRCKRGLNWLELALFSTLTLTLEFIL